MNTRINYRNPVGPDSSPLLRTVLRNDKSYLTDENWYGPLKRVRSNHRDTVPKNLSVQLFIYVASGRENERDICNAAACSYSRAANAHRKYCNNIFDDNYRLVDNKFCHFGILGMNCSLYWLAPRTLDEPWPSLSDLCPSPRRPRWSDVYALPVYRCRHRDRDASYCHSSSILQTQEHLHNEPSTFLNLKNGRLYSRCNWMSCNNSLYSCLHTCRTHLKNYHIRDSTSSISMKRYPNNWCR